jgi:geranylgeranyl reductase family protein
VRGERARLIVIGGGPAGSATATLLARAGLAVVLLDRRRFPRDKPCAEYLSPACEDVLQRLGALERLEQHGLRRARGMTLISPSGWRCTIEYYDGSCPRSALTMPRLQLDQVLLELARATGVDVREGIVVRGPLLEGRRVVGVRALGPQPDVEQEIIADLVIGADGRTSVLAGALGLRRPVRWPRRLGLVTHYEMPALPDGTGEMYVGRRSYCGLAPLPGGRVNVAAVVPLPRPGEHLSAAARLERALAALPLLQERLANARRVKPVTGAAPLAHVVRAPAGDGFLLVGDAAGFFDPFTGEGIYKALRGAELAAEVVSDAMRWGRSAAWYAPRYHQLRRQEFLARDVLSRLVQLFVQTPRLFDYAVERLARRGELRARLGAALGDLAGAGPLLSPVFLARLLRP